MKQVKWPGLPERLREAFKQADYWKENRPDVLGFTRRTGFLTGYAYKYLNGETVPDRENLFKLAALLGTTPQWLLFGDEPPAPSRSRARAGRPLPIAGGSGEVRGEGLVPPVDLLPLIRHCGLILWGWIAPSRRWAGA